MKAIISSLSQFVSLLKSKPALLTLPTFACLRPLHTQLTAPGACPRCKQGALIEQYKPMFEKAFSMMGPEDLAKAKTVLGVTEICYYTKKNGRLDLVCV